MVWCGSCLLFQLTLKDISGAPCCRQDLEYILLMKKPQCVIHFTLVCQYRIDITIESQILPTECSLSN